MESLKGRVVLLAGASGGVGSQVAKQLSASGAIVYITGRNMQKLEEVAMQAGIPASRAFQMDISDESSVNHAVSAVLAQTPYIHTLINATGIGIIKTMDTMDSASFEKVVQVNLIGAFYLVKAVLPNMKEQKKA